MHRYGVVNTPLDWGAARNYYKDSFARFWLLAEPHPGKPVQGPTVEFEFKIPSSMAFLGGLVLSPWNVGRLVVFTNPLKLIAVNLSSFNASPPKVWRSKAKSDRNQLSLVSSAVPEAATGRVFCIRWLHAQTWHHTSHAAGEFRQRSSRKRAVRVRRVQAVHGRRVVALIVEFA